MINNAKDSQKISQGKDQDGITSLPHVGKALHGWMQLMKFTIICKQSINGYTQEIASTLNTHAVRQPLSPQQLAIKPKGERNWRHEMIHALPDLQLNPDDRVEYLGVRYRVMERNDYPEYGYIQYNVSEDFDFLSEAPSYE